MATAIELDRTLKLEHLLKIAILLSLNGGFAGGVEVVDVRLVVLRVVKRHDLSRNERLESVVLVRKRRESCFNCKH